MVERYLSILWADFFIKINRYYRVFSSFTIACNKLVYNCLLFIATLLFNLAKVVKKF